MLGTFLCSKFGSREELFLGMIGLDMLPYGESCPLSFCFVAGAALVSLAATVPRLTKLQYR